jgi:glycosyltransferase involved in cell wall biosynthesis
MDVPVLLFCAATAAALGGAENHSLTLYKSLLKNNYPATMVVSKGSPFDAKLKTLQLPHVTTSSVKKHFLGIPVEPETSKLLTLCKEKHIGVIQCNEECEVVAAKQIAQKYPVRIVFTRHILKKMKKDSLKNIDVLVGVSKPIVDQATKLAKNEKLKTVLIPPMYDVEKFMNFHTTETKEAFFKNTFGLTLAPYPTLCVIANLCKPKNHALLFHALHTLIHKKGIKVELLLAGKGPLKNSLVALAKKLKISEYVHFLGFTNKVPEILSYSDMNILPSKKEGLGIALLEASLMKTPSIAADGSGMTDVIHHNETGLLFKNENADDLAKQIEFLITHKEQAKKLGDQAYTYVKENFDPEKNFQKYVSIYRNTACA